DPETGTFTPTGSLNTGRYYHTATLLNNGTVLVAGGCCGPGDDPCASAELYDPTAGTFTPSASLHTAREWHTATLLTNNKVLMTGGYENPSTLASAEMYEAATLTPPDLESIA